MMNFEQFKKQLNQINKIKKNLKNFDETPIKDLNKLPAVNGILEFKFLNNSFFMLNINNDDGVVVRYLWRDKYEPYSLELWYKLTRKENSIFFDIGAHTGIYSIVGNLNKKQNQIISIEPFYINYARLISNLHLNKISSNNCILSALSDSEGISTFGSGKISNHVSLVGQISEKGNLKVRKIKLDNFKHEKNVVGIKIDTEGHEYQALKGARETLKKFLPDIIVEINENCFDQCLDFLREFGYIFYLINEQNKNLSLIKNFDSSFIKVGEGMNCLATCKNSDEIKSFYLN